MARAVITDNNLTPLVEIFIWFCLIVIVLVVLIRLAIKLFVIHRLNLDDIFIVISLVCRSRATSYSNTHFVRSLLLVNLSASPLRQQMALESISIH